MADQVARFAKANAEGNQRFLDIDSVYDGAYLKGKRVLITGANRGLGLATARQLAEDGAEIVALGRKSSQELDALGATVLTGVDVTDTAAVEAAIAGLEGKVDIVINNAGYFMEEAESLGSLDFDEQLKQIDVCALGPLRVSSAVINAGKLAEGGRVACVSSQAGSAAWRAVQNADEGGDYGHHMSRAACNMAMVLLAEELRGKGVCVVLLHPGFNRTEMTAKYAEIWDREGAVEPAVGAKRVLHEIGLATLATTGRFVNCEDGLEIPW